MTDYRKTPIERPWSKDLDAGDLLTETQRNCLCHTRLADFDLQTLPYRFGGWIVRPMSAADHRGRRRNSVANVGVW